MVGGENQLTGTQYSAFHVQQWHNSTPDKLVHVIKGVLKLQAVLCMWYVCTTQSQISVLRSHPPQGLCRSG